MSTRLQNLCSYWPILVPAVVAAVLGAAIIFPLPPARGFTSDSAIYHYGGLLLAKGHAPYLHMWDFKPPLIYLTTGMIAFLFPGNGMLQIYAGEAVAGVLAVITVGASAAVVQDLTESNYAAAAAGFSVIAYPQYFFQLSVGLRAATGAVAFATVALWATQTERFRVAIAVATIAAGYWPVAVIAPIVVFAEARRRGEPLLPLAGILAGVTVLCVLPIALRGAFLPMLYEVLLGPLIKGEAGGPVKHIRKGLRVATRTAPLWIIGGIGSLQYLRDSRTERRLVDGWWVPAAGAFVVLWALLIDFEGAVDFYMIAAVAAIGLGTTVSRLKRDQQIGALLAVLVIVAAAWLPVYGWITTRSGSPGETAYHTHLLEQRVPPDSCHMRIGYGERRWMRLTGETNQTKRCGQVFPYAGRLPG